MNHTIREEMKFERHRALAELVIYHKNWLPDPFICWYLDGFSDHGERYLAGDPQPPWFVRAWWRFRHWQFQRASRPPSDIADVYAMSRSNITGEVHKPGGIIPLAPGQRVEYIPIREGERVELIDMKAGTRKSIVITPEMEDEAKNQCWQALHRSDAAIGDTTRGIFYWDGYEINADLLSHQLAAAYHDGAFPQGPFYRHGADLIQMLHRGGPDFIAAKAIVDGLRIRPIPLDFPLYKKTGRWHERLQQEVERREQGVSKIDARQVNDPPWAYTNIENFNGAPVIPRAGLTMEQAEKAILGLQSAMNRIAKLTPEQTLALAKAQQQGRTH